MPFVILILSAQCFFLVTPGSVSSAPLPAPVSKKFMATSSPTLLPAFLPVFDSAFLFESIFEPTFAPEYELYEPPPTPGAAEMALRQALLVEGPDGTIVEKQHADLHFHPASNIKLATALFALRRLGPDYTFSTSLATTGSINYSTGVLSGDLYVSGNDPAFRFEHAVAIAQTLNQLGIKKVTGKIVVAPGFTIDAQGSSTLAAKLLKRNLNVQTRSCLTNEAFRISRNLEASAFDLPVMGAAVVGNTPAFARVLAVQQSPPLREILKVLLCYSDNFMADRLGALLGGPRAMQKFLIQRIGLPAKSVYVDSNSGLGSDSITARSMMLVLRSLKGELSYYSLSLSDLLPVAGVDNGTLKKRFVEPQRRATVVAKTGTHIQTQGGISALAGETRTNRGVFLFVIFNRHGNVPAFRARQDLFIKGLQDRMGGPQAWPYQAQKLAVAMRVQCARKGR